jgi:hypothetical protein
MIAAGIGLLIFSAGSSIVAYQEAAKASVKKAKKKERVSPHETASWKIKGKKITIVYGRPYKKGRVVFGGLEPWGKVWRTGADEATIFETEADLMLGHSLHVTAGKYSLFTIPNPTQWTLVLNKTVNQWGAFKYDPKMDYGRVPMTVRRTPSVVEQLTIDIESKGGDEGILKIQWDETEASVPIQVH